jgi:hypothetical protein
MATRSTGITQRDHRASLDTMLGPYKRSRVFDLIILVSGVA